MKTKPVILKDMDGGTFRVTSRGLKEVTSSTINRWNTSFGAIFFAALRTETGEKFSDDALNIWAKSKYTSHILKTTASFGREENHYRVGCRRVTPAVFRRILKLAGVKPKPVKATK